MTQIALKFMYTGHDTLLLFSAHSLSAGSGAAQSNVPFKHSNQTGDSALRRAQVKPEFVFLTSFTLSQDGFGKFENGENKDVQSLSALKGTFPVFLNLVSTHFRL